MNVGLIHKTLCEVWRGTLLFGLAMAAFHTLLAYLLPTLFAQYSEQILQIEFVRTIITAMLGAELGGRIDPGAISTFVWVHPVVLALLWAQEITFCARMPAGEVDRGTIDTLLALPVSRRGVYVSVSVAFLACGVFVVAMALVGNRFGVLFSDSSVDTPVATLVKVLCNMFAMYMAVGGTAFLVSACCDGGAKAIGIVFAVVLASFFLTFLAQLWQPAKAVSFLSVMHYYKPLLIVRDAAWPVRDLVVLLAIGAVSWLVGGAIFARRDVCTV